MHLCRGVPNILTCAPDPKPRKSRTLIPTWDWARNRLACWTEIDMYVQTNQAGSTIAGPYTAGAVMQIPEQFYNPTTMTPIGTALSSPQQSAILLSPTTS